MTTRKYSKRKVESAAEAEGVKITWGGRWTWHIGALDIALCR